MRAFRRSYHLWKTRKLFFDLECATSSFTATSLFTRLCFDEKKSAFDRRAFVDVPAFLLYLEAQPGIIIKSRVVTAAHRSRFQANVGFVSCAVMQLERETTLSNKAIHPFITAIISRTTSGV